uniref:Sushi domain-containing protein n=1 Tax=Chrysemys picta bellii TaxID=8478 RepID=A0A8C3IMG9_CHRPI
MRKTPASSSCLARSKAEKTKLAFETAAVTSAQNAALGPESSRSIFAPWLVRLQPSPARAFVPPRRLSVALPAGSHQSGANRGSWGEPGAAGAATPLLAASLGGRRPGGQRRLCGLRPRLPGGRPQLASRSYAARASSPSAAAASRERAPTLGTRAQRPTVRHPVGSGSVPHMRSVRRGVIPGYSSAPAPWSCCGRAGLRVSQRCWCSRCFPGERWVFHLKKRRHIRGLNLLLASQKKHSNCGAPPRLISAELQDEFKTQTDFAVGTTVRYSCRSGYQRVPGVPPTLTCERDSVWPEPKEFCQRKSCGHPGDLENGKVHITDLLFGSSITFSCDEGFRLIGSRTSQCVIDGTRVTWDHQIPFCEKIPCRPPPEIENGRYTGDPNNEYAYGATVIYSCDTVPRGTPSFSLIGEATIHCTVGEAQNGIWSGEPPECKVVKCSNVEVENGRKLSGFGPSYTYQDAITFGCDAGYFLVGRNVIKCHANNSWSPAIPQCERGICSALVFPHGKVLPSEPQYFDGDSVTLTCDANYFLLNGAKSMTVHCKKNTWDPPVQTCQMVKCSNVEVENGRKLSGFGPSYTYQDAITFGCNAGYFLVGRNEIKCQANNSWSPAIPTCEEITPTVCGTPQFSNGQILPSKPRYVTGDRITLTCEANYVLFDGAKSMTVHCKGNNVWDPPVQTCQNVCPDPVSTHRNVKSGAKHHYVVGDNVTIECSTVYTLHGEPNIQCTGELQWKPAIPECSLSLYIKISIGVLVIAAILMAICIYKRYFSQKGKDVSTSLTAQYTSCKT